MGIVAEQLERDLCHDIQQRGIVVWLDPEARARPFAEGLRQRFQDKAFPYPVVVFDGSFLATLYALEPHLAGETVYLLLYVPGLEEAALRHSPLLEVLLAGHPVRKSLPDAVQSTAAALVPASDLARFLANWDGRLESADRWLTTRATDDPRVVRMLERETPADVVIDLLTDKKLLNTYDLHIGDLKNWLQNTFGFALPADGDTAFDLFARHLLCVEYVADLAPEPPSSAMGAYAELAPAVVEVCRHAVASFRTRHADAYERVALDVEAQIHAERAWARGKALGLVDTFRFEDEELARQALEALEEGRAAPAIAFATQRLGSEDAPGSFWVGRSQRRRWLWEWIREAARLWQMTAPASAPVGWRSLRDAVETYTRDLAPVDRSHRRFEQYDARLRSLSQLEEFPRTRSVVRQLRQRVRRYLDAWAGWFNDLCDTAGPLPPPDLQLRQVFEEDVLPRVHQGGAGGEPVALFMVDALRYELALELRDALVGVPEGSCTLKARLAELPTETAIGMNVIPPTARAGRLTPTWGDKSIRGFRAGEFAVTAPKDREKAISQRVGMSPVPWWKLEDVIAQEPEALRRKLAGARVLVVHSREIDSAGHAGIGIAHFDSLIGQLVAAFHRLNAAGVRSFVFTADHGFLLGDETAVRARMPDGVYPVAPSRFVPSDAPDGPPARFLLSREADTRPGWSCFPLGALGYETEPTRPGWMLFARDTRVFSSEIPPFVHGGNTLQERVVPVLYVNRTPPAATTAPRRRIVAEILGKSFGAHEVEIRVLDDGQGGLGFMAQELDLSFRVADRADVSVVIGEVKEAEALTGATVRVRVGDRPARVWFRLEGASEGVARVEIHGVSDNLAIVSLSQPIPVVVNVKATTADSPAPMLFPPPQLASSTTDWLAALPADLLPFREVLRQIDDTRALSEEQLVGLLGGPPVGMRLARAFARLMADTRMRAHLPFDVSIHDSAGRKQYRREIRK